MYDVSLELESSIKRDRDLQNSNAYEEEKVAKVGFICITRAIRQPPIMLPLVPSQYLNCLGVLEV